MSKQLAIKILKETSNAKLEKILKKFGYNVSVNFLTRGMVESKIIDKMQSYTVGEIEDFIKNENG